MTTKSRYQAPALKKGLEILELLATAEAGLSMSDISGALGRSVSEIFRMLQVLEEHRYILRDESGFRLTSRLFTMGMRQPPMRDLVSTALPVMQELVRETGQSCHLAVPSGSDMVVIAGLEAPGLIGFAVRIGYRRPLHLSASGRVLLAFQPSAIRAEMLAEVQEAGHLVDEEALLPILDGLTANGGGASSSPVLNGIIDVSVPVLSGYVASAALTIPFVDGPGSRVALPEVRAALQAAAADVSRQLAPSDHPDQMALLQA